VIWSQRLIAFAVILQSIELLQIRKSFSDQGVWRWSSIQRDFSFLWVRKVLGFFLAYRDFLILIWARLFSAALLLIVFEGPAQKVLLGVLFLSSVLISVRWRSTFNGGSDYMTNVVTLSLFVASLFSGSVLITKLCLGYIAIQTCLSYFVAGVVKAKNSDWREGLALPQFLRMPSYDAPEWIEKKFSNLSISKIASCTVILFELSFPFALLSPRICLIYIGLAVLFHLANVYVFGLNRFVWAWLAAYPALYFWS
jgi:hypothetical protein